VTWRDIASGIGEWVKEQAGMLANAVYNDFTKEQGMKGATEITNALFTGNAYGPGSSMAPNVQEQDNPLHGNAGEVWGQSKDQGSPDIGPPAIDGEIIPPDKGGGGQAKQLESPFIDRPREGQQRSYQDLIRDAPDRQGPDRDRDKGMDR